MDAYGPEEQALGWYYYLENRIRFPFQAKYIRAKAISPLLKGSPGSWRARACLDDCRVVCSHHRCQALEFRPKLREFRAIIIALVVVRGDLLLLFRNL